MCQIKQLDRFVLNGLLRLNNKFSLLKSFIFCCHRLNYESCKGHMGIYGKKFQRTSNFKSSFTKQLLIGFDDLASTPIKLRLLIREITVKKYLLKKRVKKQNRIFCKKKVCLKITGQFPYSKAKMRGICPKKFL